MAIRGVYFDLGRVLVHFDWTEALQKIASKSPLSAEEVRAQLLTDIKLVEYETGAIDCATFFSHHRERLRFDGSWEELREVWNSVFSPLDQHVALARKLAPHYRLGIISNTGHAHITFLEREYDFFELFPVRVYSHQVRCMKPHREIYDHAAAAHGLRPEESLFLDDLKPNVEGAALLGWKTIHVTPGIDLKEALLAHGVHQAGD